jgi:hypothetical protein
MAKSNKCRKSTASWTSGQFVGFRPTTFESLPCVGLASAEEMQAECRLAFPTDRLFFGLFLRQRHATRIFLNLV